MVWHWNWHVFLLDWFAVVLPNTVQSNYVDLETSILTSDKLWEVKRCVTFTFCAELDRLCSKRWLLHILRTKYTFKLVIRLLLIGLAWPHRLENGALLPGVKVPQTSFAFAPIFHSLRATATKHATIPYKWKLVTEFYISAGLKSGVLIFFLDQHFDLVGNKVLIEGCPGQTR